VNLAVNSLTGLVPGGPCGPPAALPELDLAAYDPHSDPAVRVRTQDSAIIPPSFLGPAAWDPHSIGVGS
jgi:hypothetical protein